MGLLNKERSLVALLREIAQEQGYAFTGFSHDWILRLEKGGVARHIFGYNFEINSATARLLAADKSAVSDLLGHQKIPRVEHKLFLHPKLGGYVSSEGNWRDMQAFAETNGYPIVVKPNEGTGGEDIIRVETALELEEAVTQLFDSHRAICFSPYQEIEREYRVIVLDDESLLLYAKLRPEVIGDGRSTILELIESLLKDKKLPQAIASQVIDAQGNKLSQVVDKDQKVVLGWKHNLGEGATPLLVEDVGLQDQLEQIAQAARRAINIRFASIDVVQVGEKLYVLEINAGVMLEYFVRHFPGERERAKAIYAQAVAKMFGDS